MQPARRLPHAKQDPEQPHGLAPEVGAAIRAAQEKLAHSIQVANLSDDDLGAVLAAMSDALGAQYRMLTDHALAVTSVGISVDDLQRRLDAAVERAVRRNGPAIWRSYDRPRAVLLGAFLAVLLLAGGAALDWWWWGGGDVLSVCRAGQVMKDASGRTYCAAWLR